MTRNIQDHLQPTGLSNARKIIGNQPGVLDPTQPSRLCRLPGAKLSFAAFDPLTAYAQDIPDLNKLSLQTELYRPKRVVIETAPTGECTWRFVPSAKREEGVADEGTWPRVVDLCGEFVELTQDQWDIYKLDPLYECFVRVTVTTIRNVSQYYPPSPKPSGKRLGSHSPSPTRTMPPPPATSSKKASVETDSDDEEEVEYMITQESLDRRRSTARQKREQLKKDRLERRNKLHRKIDLLSQNDENHHNDHYIQTVPQSLHPSLGGSVTPEQGKRKAASALDTSWSPDARELEELRLRASNNYTTTFNTKRTRTAFPLPTKIGYGRIRLGRAQRKQQRRADEAEARRWEREKRLINEIMNDIPQHGPGRFASGETQQDIPYSAGVPDPPNGEPLKDDTQTQQEEMIDEEVTRLAAIEESRRKLAELERDRPLWEQEAKKRRLREEAEERALRAKAEERKAREAKAKAEADVKAQKEREREEMKKREQEKNVKRERELREQERRQRRQRWSFGPWTTQRALERYRVLSEDFDNTKFTVELPLVPDDVPWPVLQPPKSFSIEDVSWDAVERFFEAARPHMRHQDYKVLVEKSHRRFHPDRWRSRNLLRTVQDEAVRGCMEVAANTVAQALTPLWRSLTGR